MIEMEEMVISVGESGCGLCGAASVRVYDEETEFFNGNPMDYPTWEFCPNCGQGMEDVPPEVLRYIGVDKNSPQEAKALEEWVASALTKPSAKPSGRGGS
ncbi:MAG: hypothetical protein DRG82_15880 [Deltaproteobacteria bacterium]|nr:MAG: hypothetical protein DRG82_15880 [Deltaproteobacteria bacterium]